MTNLFNFGTRSYELGLMVNLLLKGALDFQLSQGQIRQAAGIYQGTWVVG